MNKRWVKRLYEQLPVLIDKGILSPETAGRLRDYYGTAECRAGQKTAVVMFSILGSLFIGLGIVLLLAYNWSKQLPVSVRTALSISPLIIAQALVFYTMRRRRNSDAWREGSASFLFLMTGASIALITQIYHIPNDYFDFLLTWMLLGLPLVYLVNVTVPAMLYFVGITVWACYGKDSGTNTMFFWPLAAVIVPHMAQIYKKSPSAVRSAFLGWVVSVCLCIAIGVTLSEIVGAFGVIIYSCFFSVLCITGLLWFNRDSVIWRCPFQTVGISGILIIAFVLTFPILKWTNWNFPDFASSTPEYILGILLAVTYILLLLKLIKRVRNAVFFFILLPLVASVLYVLSAFQNAGLFISLLSNLYLLALGISAISAGLRDERLDIMNGGMIIMIVWTAVRFFDWKLGFIMRGIAFIIIGSGFLAANIMLIRSRRRAKREKKDLRPGIVLLSGCSTDCGSGFYDCA